MNEIFIDKSEIGFKYILEHLRNPDYKIPKKYQGELNFYGIDYDVDDIEDNEIDVLNKIFRELKRMNDLNKQEMEELKQKEEEILERQEDWKKLAEEEADFL